MFARITFCSGSKPAKVTTSVMGYSVIPAIVKLPIESAVVPIVLFLTVTLAYGMPSLFALVTRPVTCADTTKGKKNAEK